MPPATSFSIVWWTGRWALMTGHPMQQRSSDPFKYSVEHLEWVREKNKERETTSTWSYTHSHGSTGLRSYARARYSHTDKLRSHTRKHNQRRRALQIQLYDSLSRPYRLYTYKTTGQIFTTFRRRWM